MCKIIITIILIFGPVLGNKIPSSISCWKYQSQDTRIKSYQIPIISLLHSFLQFKHTTVSLPVGKTGGPSWSWDQGVVVADSKQGKREPMSTMRKITWGAGCAVWPFTHLLWVVSHHFTQLYTDGEKWLYNYVGCILICPDLISSWQVGYVWKVSKFVIWATFVYQIQ